MISAHYYRLEPTRRRRHRIYLPFFLCWRLHSLRSGSIRAWKSGEILQLMLADIERRRRFPPPPSLGSVMSLTTKTIYVLLSTHIRYSDCFYDVSFIRRRSYAVLFVFLFSVAASLFLAPPILLNVNATSSPYAPLAHWSPLNLFLSVE